MSGWFAFAVVTCIILCCGSMLAMMLLRAAWKRREAESLDSTDLKALEEAAFLLIEDLKSEVDRGIAEIDARKAELERIIAAADEKLTSLREFANIPVTAGDALPSPERILDMASVGADSADIARRAGLGCAEVKLMLRMAKAKNG